MICPNCLIQMNQLEEISGGTAQDTKYITWELKHCKQCNRKVVEYYEARVISDEEYHLGDLTVLINER